MGVFGFVKRVICGLARVGGKNWKVSWTWTLPTFSKKKEIKLPEPKKATYFSEDEIEGLDQELVAKLDMARHYAGIPFIIKSGFRTKEQNDAVGGVLDSAHLIGKAADIACPDSHARFLIIKGLMAAGFKRIEIGTAHVHADTDESKPSEVLWLGVSH